MSTSASDPAPPAPPPAPAPAFGAAGRLGTCPSEIDMTVSVIGGLKVVLFIFNMTNGKQRKRITFFTFSNVSLMLDLLTYLLNNSLNCAK